MYLKLSSVSLRNVLLKLSLRWRFGLNNYYFKCFIIGLVLGLIWENRRHCSLLCLVHGVGSLRTRRADVVNRLSCLANQSRVARGKEGFREIDSSDESFEGQSKCGDVQMYIMIK
ncbi:hypothetical protein PO909_025714, partial [Leuciscus waleckii]